MNLIVKSPPKYTNFDGMKRRNNAKRVLLGALYGRGSKSIAEQLGISVEEASKIMDDFFKAFPVTKKWMDDAQQSAHKDGKTTDIFGRERHLEHVLNNKYEFRYMSASDKNNKTLKGELLYKHYKTPNPFLICSSNTVPDELVKTYTDKLENAKNYKQKKAIISELTNNHIELIDNTGDIAQGERQSVNFKCQAPSASLIKLAIIAIENNTQLKELGFELLLTVHDEVIGQVSKENSEESQKIIKEIMESVGNAFLNVPMICDVSEEPSGHWYMSAEETALNDKFSKMKGEGISSEEAYKILCKDFEEILPENIYANLFEGKYLR